MKEIAYKFFTAVFLMMIFLGMLHAMEMLSDMSDHNYTKKIMKKNSGLASAGPEIPAVSAKAPAEAMRTEPAPITAEDLSYIYIDGIRFDFPCNLAQIQEHFETKKDSYTYDEKTGEYSGWTILMKNGVGTYNIYYSSAVKDPSPEECIVNSIRSFKYSKKYSPQLVIAGIDIFNTSDEEYIRLAALDENEYLLTNTIAFPSGSDGYVVFYYLDIKGIRYYQNDDPFLPSILERSDPVLIKTELRLPEDYDPEIVPEHKEELREFALEYYAYDDDMYYSTRKYREEIERMVTENYDTAYEFLAVIAYEFDTDAYFELTQIESITHYDKEADKTYDTGYLKVNATCYIEEYDDPIKAEMILKAGDRLGDALLIQMDD